MYRCRLYILKIDNHGNLNFAGYSDYGNQWQFADLDIIAASWDDYQREPVSSQTHLYYRETMDPALLFVSTHVFTMPLQFIGVKRLSILICKIII